MAKINLQAKIIPTRRCMFAFYYIDKKSVCENLCRRLSKSSDVVKNSQKAFDDLNFGNLWKPLKIFRKHSAIVEKQAFSFDNLYFFG